MKEIHEEDNPLLEKGLNDQTIFNIQNTQSWLNSQFSSILKPYKITTNQLHVLRILHAADSRPVSVGKIKSQMPDQMPDVSRIIERLKSKKLITRTVNRSDRREVNIKLSRKGRHLVEEVENQEHLSRITNGLTEEEMKRLNELLQKLRNHN